MPHPLHQQVRQAFVYRCGYCGVDEAKVGAELTVDHYQPTASGGTDQIDNLVYACHRCNQYKGDYWPTPERIGSGFYVLHPHRHSVAEHWHENEDTGELEPSTVTGTFHIRLLHLNRSQLVVHRLEQRAVTILL
jgi:HNH endonuclease